MGPASATVPATMSVPITDPIAAEALANARATRMAPRPTGGELVLAKGYYGSAREAFRHAAYGDALRLGRQAEAATPLAANNALMAQALFAVGNYNGAAVEARAAAATGPLTTWQTLLDYYAFNVARYRNQLQALEQYVRDYPSASPGHFLLGYEYLIAGQTERGQDQLAIALVLDPLDLVAKRLLEREGVTVSGASPPHSANSNNHAASQRPVVR